MKVVVTGNAWLGHGVGSVASAIEDMLAAASDEVLVASYSIGTGAGSLLDRLELTAQRGVRVVLLVNRLAGQPFEVRQRLLLLVRDYPWCRLLDFFPAREDEDLHAKVIVVDRRRALVGSANLSRHGLLTNHELAVLIDEQSVADEIARAVDLLIQDRQLVHEVGREVN